MSNALCIKQVISSNTPDFSHKEHDYISFDCGFFSYFICYSESVFQKYLRVSNTRKATI